MGNIILGVLIGIAIMLILMAIATQVEKRNKRINIEHEFEKDIETNIRKNTWAIANPPKFKLLDKVHLHLYDDSYHKNRDKRYENLVFTIIKIECCVGWRDIIIYNKEENITLKYSEEILSSIK